nr:hypothetical protein GCM10020092_051540 [Actinoplanes digitatis]
MKVETAALVKRYGSHAALDGVDLSVPASSVYALVGPNGAGKTTLLGILSGLRRATSGSVRLGAGPGRIACLPDTPQFDPWLTGREVVALAAHLAGRPSGVTIPALRIEAVLAETGLAGAADRRVGGYSRGMLQRLGLAATVVGEPELLLLDEPASALDPAGRREVLDLIARMRGRATVVFSSHILADVQEVCDRIGVLREGRLLFQGTLEELIVGRATPAYRVRLRSGRDRAEPLLRRQPWVTSLRADRGDLLVGVRTLGEAETFLAGVLARAGAGVVSLGPQEARLEDVLAGAVAGLLLGSACAWYETTVLLGAPSAGAMVAGIAYGIVFLAFAVALVALVAVLVRGVLAAAGLTMGLLLFIGVLGGATGASTWLPTGLLGALADLTAGASAADYLPGLVVTVLLAAVALTGAVVLGDRREL